MIESLWVKNQSGDKLNLNLRSSLQETGLLIINLSGLGSPKVTVNGSGGPNIDGTRVNSLKVDPRIINLTLVIPKIGDAEEVARALLYKFFAIKQKLQLGVVTTTREVTIDCYVEQNNLNHFAQIENTPISLYCPNPYFKDVNTTTLVVAERSVLPSFSFPFSNEHLTVDMLIFGEVLETPSTPLYNSGVNIGCVFNITINESVVDFGIIRIYNTNGDQVMRIDTSVIARSMESIFNAGDQIVINTIKGEKSIKVIHLGVSYNVLGAINIFDNWLQIKPGQNLISIESDDHSTGLQLEVSYTSQYEGV